MKKQQFLFLISVMLMICFGCKKDSDTTTEGIVNDAVGVYSGNWVVKGSQASGTCEVVKVTDSTVDLKMIILGTSLPTLPSVKTSDGGNGKINLSYSDSSGKANGTIQNNTITITIDDGTTTISFSGTKH